MHVAALPLLAGRYLLSAAVYDKTMLFPYDIMTAFITLPCITKGEANDLALAF